ncbi:MAG: hypothetical protein KIS92_02185 [Planctomycetota bacterium]|nr:hypothetical protein [Planctomycetota bacterium]
MMRSTRAILLAAGLLTATGAAVAVWPAPQGSPKSIIDLSKSGANEDALLREVQQSSGAYEVTPDDILRMKEANVPDTVIVEMLEKWGAVEQQKQVTRD